MFQVRAVSFREIYVGDFLAIPTVLVTCFGMVSLRDQPINRESKGHFESPVFFCVFKLPSMIRFFLFEWKGVADEKKNNIFFLKKMATSKRKKKRKNHSKQRSATIPGLPGNI